MQIKSVADIVGPWKDPEFDSGLISRCRQAWHIPIPELTNEMLATYLRQEIATDAVLEEANKRLRTCFDDETELYEGELAIAVQKVMESQAKSSTA